MQQSMIKCLKIIAKNVHYPIFVVVESQYFYFSWRTIFFATIQLPYPRPAVVIAAAKFLFMLIIFYRLLRLEKCSV